MIGSSNYRWRANGNCSKSFSAAERKLLINFLSRMHAQVVDTGVSGKRRGNS